MIRTDGVEACRRVRVESDPWLPLAVRWGDDAPAPLLRLWVADRALGYAEVAVGRDSGALRRLVLIDLPGPAGREAGPLAPGRRDVVPVLDRAMWPWRHTPDYREPARDDVDVVGELSCSVTDERFTVRLADGPVYELLPVGAVRVGVAADGGLLRVDVPLTSVDAGWRTTWAQRHGTRTRPDEGATGA
ncbi:hypothetical protein [Cellulomonas sp.]|uniref:hypothetical protein n=1 Tax=Cellulomonas sp. TaxID=40001 RepID=UPI002811C449|nr:hypothetical protein [Cellulomonas sp.]